MGRVSDAEEQLKKAASIRKRIGTNAYLDQVHIEAKGNLSSEEVRVRTVPPWKRYGLRKL